MLKHETDRLPKRVVLLGGNGFIGRVLAQKLRADSVEVVPLGSKDVDLAQPSAPAALRERVGREDALVFLSALTPDKGKDPDTLMKNLAMSRNVAEIVGAGGCSHLLYMSSDAVYDGSIHPLRESVPCAADGLYGYMHIGREIMLKEAAAKGKVPYAVLRPCAVYGAGDTHNGYGPNRFLRAALKDKVIKLFGEGEEMRDHVHVDDLCEVARRTLAGRSVGLLNVATGTAVSFMSVACRLADLLGGGVRIETAPRSGPVSHRHFDISELAAAFPTLRFATLEEGLRKTLAQTRQA